MAYLGVSNRYNEVIYSGSATNKPILKINDIVVNDLNTLPENNKISSIQKIHNIIKIGNNRFSLDNFVAQELEIKIYDFDYSLYEDTELPENKYNVIDLKIATLVDDVWEEVPIGIFNIVGTPTTDKRLTTIKAKCNRIKFEIPYNAKPIIDENDGKVEIGTLLQDICNNCGVQLGTTEPFINSTTEIGVYDSTVNANVYVADICEKAGSIAVIGRDGKLYLIPINNNLYKHNLDVNLVKGQGTLTYGDKFVFDRVCYEFAVNKYATPLDATSNTTLFINSANPYISSQEEIDNIYNSINGFTIENLKFEIMGNPCVDAWDIVAFTKDDVEHKTLANNTLMFNGIFQHKFETSIGTKETVKENVTIKGQRVEKKVVKAELDNINGEVKILTATTETIQEDMANKYYTIEQSNELIQNAQTGITNTFSEAGGNNVFRNTGLWFEENGGYEFWIGSVKKATNDNAANHNSMMIQSGSLIQDQEVSNGNYAISFYYQKLSEFANASVVINDVEYPLDSLSVKQFYTGQKDSQTNEYITQPIVVNAGHLTIEFKCDMDNGLEVYDLMANKGTVKLAYSQNQNETTTDTVNISKGITITSSNIDVIFKANADGIRIYTMSGIIKTYFTDKGLTTKEAIIEDEAQIVGILRQKVGDQIWDSLI